TGKPARRETNTIPNWAGSCWYYLRFLDPRNARAAWDPSKEKYWMPVDLYVGGSEHAVLHLLYARFWHKVLFDLGFVSTKEPFKRLFHQGMILGENGEKMSKSRGNVISVDTVLSEHGADVLRLFEMFLGPVEVVKPWNTRGIEGVRRFVNKVWRLLVDTRTDETRTLATVPLPPDLDRLLHQTIRKVTEGIEGMRFNTGIAQMMTFVNRLGQEERPPRAAVETLALLLAPIAPHLGEEMWERLGHEGGVMCAPWPSFDPARAREEGVEVVVQVNGKVRDQMEVPLGTSREELEARSRGLPKVQAYLAAGRVAKVVVVPDRLVNFVVAGWGA
ncbi:MAG: class I tRNA ligase family protein, partial [Planctomycetes bacterium]|nr:class I tRNA ligase family protein [Planctomycetota bacterium]